jgi:hypothetical protein
MADDAGWNRKARDLPIRDPDTPRKTVTETAETRSEDEPDGRGLFPRCPDDLKGFVQAAEKVCLAQPPTPSGLLIFGQANNS